jgi:hypothetical protein
VKKFGVHESFHRAAVIRPNRNLRPAIAHIVKPGNTLSLRQPQDFGAAFLEGRARAQF